MTNPTETTGDIIAKLERDLKSALEEIERKSFALHGLERENAALRAELAEIDLALSRRDALANCPTRYDKIMLACRAAGEKEKAEQELAEAEKVLQTLGDTITELREDLRQARELTEMLKRVQYNGPADDAYKCQICRCVTALHHKPDCELDLLLKGQERGGI